MKLTAHKFASVFGSCVIAVSLCSGCATQPDVTRIPMNRADLNYFRIDCSRKEEQVRMLQSMRITADEQFAAQMRIMVKPYEYVTDPNAYSVNHSIGYGHVNKYINHHLKALSEC